MIMRDLPMPADFPRNVGLGQLKGEDVAVAYTKYLPDMLVVILQKNFVATGGQFDKRPFSDGQASLHTAGGQVACVKINKLKEIMSKPWPSNEYGRFDRQDLPLVRYYDDGKLLTFWKADEEPKMFSGVSHITLERCKVIALKLSDGTIGGVCVLKVPELIRITESVD